MHVPDGFLDAPTSVALGLVAAAGVGLALRHTRRELDDRVAPITGLVAVFIFAGQMLNFPVGAGTSGHLLGGALAAVLVGPWVATLCVTVVLVVQAVLFADGGLTALGTNVTLMALIGVWAGWGAFLLARRLLGRRLARVPIAAGVAGFVSVLAAATGFVIAYAVGGVVALPLPTLTGTMLGWHALIGLGEAVITALVVASVLATRPDLVRGARELLDEAPLVLATAGTRS